jgi:hypothetical protein
VPWFRYPDEVDPNLRGAPPVRDRVAPPNKGIIEDEGTYASRKGAAQDALAFLEGKADELHEAGDHRQWFARVYQYVTEGEINAAENGAFYYPSYVMSSVAYFEKVYQDNFDAFENGGEVEEHWRTAFEQCAAADGFSFGDALAIVGGGLAGGLVGSRGGLLTGVAGGLAGAWLGNASKALNDAVASLVVSMKAHIRYDLPRCEAWVFSSQYAGMENAKMRNFQPDFMAMGGVFDQAGARLNADMQTEFGLPVTLMPGSLQDLAMSSWFDADMASERADTWERAEQLVASGQSEDDPYAVGPDGHLHGDVTGADHMSGVTGIPGRLRPSMDTSASRQDDDEVRDDVSRTGVAGLAQRGTTERIQMIRSLLSGLTLNGDEASILDILAASLAAGDLVTVISGVNAHDLASDMHGDEWRTLRDSYLIPHYYPRCGTYEAATLIVKCCGGWTFGWEETMIADVLEARSEPDRRAIVTMVGERTTGLAGGYAEGYARIVDEVGSRAETLLPAP